MLLPEKVVSHMSQANPHQLTKKQHVFPEASLKRFLNDRGFVHVAWLDGKSGYRPPGNQMFLSGRAWEQRSEVSSHKVEADFQNLATKISGNTVNSLNAEQSKTAAEMASIWLSRWYLKNNPSPDIKLDMAPPEVMNKCIPMGFDSHDDYRDAAEKAGLVAEGSDGSIPGRLQSWPRFRRQKAQLRKQLDGLSWGIVRALEAEFIVPDVSLDGILPISPTVLLIAGKTDLTASRDDVCELNRRMKAGSREWFFARDLEKSPFPNS